jgi:hypothetical protein
MRTRRLFANMTAALAGCVLLLAGGHPAQAHHHGYGGGHVGVMIHPHGLYLGGGLVATRILNQQGGTELLRHGGGISLYGGLRVGPLLALELGWTGTLHNPALVSTAFGPDVDYLVLNALTGDAKIFIGSSSPALEPYLQGGLGLYMLDSEYFGTQSLGAGFQLGGGLDFHIVPFLDLGFRALYRGMRMGPPNADYDNTFVSALTVEGQLTFKF